MANQNGAIARFLAKWLMIPVGLAAVGFFVVGPRLGAKGRQEAKAERSASDPLKDAPSEGPKITGNPDVSISSRPVTRRRTPRKPRSESRPSEPGEETKAPEIPSPDEEPPTRDG